MQELFTKFIAKFTLPMLKRELKAFSLMMIGVFSAAFGLQGFLLKNSFIDGGVTGISLLVTEVTGLPLPILIVLINAPFVAIGYRQIGRIFALKSIGAIVNLAIVLAVFHFPVVTTDKLLVAAFGGFFLGAGIGFAMRGGAVLDGTEIVAIQLSKKTGLTVGDIILIFNVFIFSVAAWLLSVETALFSILAYLSAAKTVDFVIAGVEEYIGVTIISCEPDKVRQMIIDDMGRGVTLYQGKRGYGNHGQRSEEIDIVWTVITRLELGKLQQEVERIDPEAFVVMTSVKDTKGGMIKKRPLH